MPARPVLRIQFVFDADRPSEVTIVRDYPSVSYPVPAVGDIIERHDLAACESPEKPNSGLYRVVKRWWDFYPEITIVSLDLEWEPV
jgi:hypothetical protein